MATIEEQLASFQRFVAEQLAAGTEKSTIDELYDQWRVENPTDSELDENVAAVKASLQDLHNGDRGMPHDEHMRDLRQHYDLPADE